MKTSNKQISDKNNGPVIIGGIGGSGTRVVAEILQMFDFFLGNDLNNAQDNLSYTLLFKRPEWFRMNKENTDLINTGLHILKKTLIGPKSFTGNEMKYIDEATQMLAKKGHNVHTLSGNGMEAYKRREKLMEEKSLMDGDFKGWGWKEPNSFLLLENYKQVFPDFKYIHVIRHGLDMAFSSNKNQLYNWGELFGVPEPKSEGEACEAQFRYWVVANRWALKKGSELGKQHFLQVSFDALCDKPRIEIEKIITFLGINPNRETVENAVLLPKIPATSGRFREYDITGFGKGDIEFLRYLGYSNY